MTRICARLARAGPWVYARGSGVGSSCRPRTGLVSFNRADPAGKRLRTLFAGALGLIVLLLAFFAYSLADSQRQQRRDLENRFHDRADVSAAVTDAIFNSASAQTQVQNAARFGGSTINPATLARTAEQSQARYVEIIAGNGRVLAATPGAPRRSPATASHVAAALRTGGIQLSDVLRGPRGSPVIESASPFPTTHGRRVQLSGVQAPLLSRFLGGFLSRVPNVASATSYVVDSNGNLVAGTGAAARTGARLPDRELAAALTKQGEGSYDGDRYFASTPIGGSPWSVVLSTSKSRLYASVNGSSRTIPWLIFGAFALVAAGGLVLFRRVLVSNAQLQRAELSRVHALEINDNVVQRLVVAKLALERGATETSQEKLAETLRETQQLVTTLLEQKEITPGVLRRGEAAPTEEPPEPKRPVERA
jgi:hypothetical protein